MASGPPPSQRLLRALRSRDWSERMTAIEAIRASRDLRFARRLWLLSRFHLAPREVREAARETYRLLLRCEAAGAGRLSAVERTPSGRLSPAPQRLSPFPRW